MRIVRAVALIWAIAYASTALADVTLTNASKPYATPSETAEFIKESFDALRLADSRDSAIASYNKIEQSYEPLSMGTEVFAEEIRLRLQREPLVDTIEYLANIIGKFSDSAPLPGDSPALLHEKMGRLRVYLKSLEAVLDELLGLRDPLAPLDEGASTILSNFREAFKWYPAILFNSSMKLIIETEIDNVHDHLQAAERLLQA